MTNSELAKVISELQRQLAVIEEKERSREKSFDTLIRQIEKLEKEVEEIHTMANRWKGGFLVLAAIGGIVGWVLSSARSVMAFFNGGN